MADTTVECNKEETIDKIVTKLKKKNVKSSHLDEFVHNTASNAAREINKDGLSAQISFLLLRGWTESEIMETV